MIYLINMNETLVLNVAIKFNWWNEYHGYVL